MTLSHYLKTQAYNNAWANYRLLKACAELTREDFRARRTSFFPSIHATLNHILTVDWFYIDALERDLAGQPPHPDSYSFFNVDNPFDTCVDLQREQAKADRRLLAYCTKLDDFSLNHYVTIIRPEQMQKESRVRLLAHLFQHQIHHRGQAHAMLAGSRVKPPQLDEFFSEGESDLRAADFAALGWSEEMIWGRGT